MAPLSRLAKLFVKISDNLTDEDVRNLRSLLAIERVLGKARVQHATSLEILHMLVDNATIGERNLGFLVEVLISLRKQDLAKEAIRLEEEHKVKEREPQDSDDRVPDTSAPEDGEVEYSTAKSNTPDGPDDSGPEETEAKAVLKPEGATEPAVILVGNLGDTTTEKQVYSRRRPAPTLKRQQEDQQEKQKSGDKTKPKNVGHANRSSSKLIFCGLILLLLALLWRLLIKNENWQDYQKLGLSHYNMGQYESALPWFLKVLEIQEARGDKAGQINARLNVANVYRLLGKTDQATSHFDTALLLAEETGNQQGQMKVYYWMGEMQREQLNSPHTSIQYYEQALELTRQLEDRRQEGWAYNRLGLAHVNMEKYETALQWYKKALKIQEEDGDKKKQMLEHTDLGFTYKLIGAAEQATSHYNTVLQMALQTGDQHQEMDVYCKLGDVQRELFHSPRTAKHYYEQYLALAKTLGNRYEEFVACHKLGLAHFNMGEYEVSLEWHQKHLMISQERSDKKEQKVAHGHIAESYRALGKLDLARFHYQSAMTIAIETGNKQSQEYYTKRLASL